MNSRAKGARGERQWRDELRANGYEARRGQQYSGSSESPDVVCAALPWVHFEVKAVERLNIEDAMEQARRDCAAKKHLTPALSPTGGEGEFQLINKVPIVAHKRSHRRWLVTMEAEFFFELVREFQPKADTSGKAPNSKRQTPAVSGTEGSEGHEGLRGQGSPFPPSSAAKDVGLTPKESGGPEDYLGRGACCGQ